MKCYLCDKEIKGPEGGIHPAGGFGWRHLTCDPQELVQGLAVTEAGDASSMYEADKNGDVTLTKYGALITARNAADVDRQRSARGGNR